MKPLLLSILLFTLNCQTMGRQDWNMVVTNPQSIPNPELKTQPYEFEDENVYISVGPYIGIPQVVPIPSDNGFHFIIYNKTNEHITIDFDDTSFVGTTGYTTWLLFYPSEKIDEDKVSITIPPKSQFHRKLYTSLSPVRKSAQEKLYLGKKTYYRDVRMSFPMLIGEQKKYYVLDIMFYFQEGERDSFGRVIVPSPIFLKRDNKYGIEVK